MFMLMLNAQLAMSSADNTTCKGYDARHEKCGKSVIQEGSQKPTNVT